jgi:nucleotide-binding universal stress UspA family protein
MARFVIASARVPRVVDAVRQIAALLGTEHRFIVLLVVRPSLVASPVSDSGDATGRLALSGETEPEDVLLSAERVEADARSELDDALRELHLNARVRVATGDPGETICRIAAEERADLIVIGRREQSRARRILGSMTQHVIDHADSPVLVVHEHDGAR